VIDPAVAVPAALEKHKSVGRVRLVGSRAAGREHDFSDWDFIVDTEDFESLERDLHELVAPLRPLSELWDPYTFRACYMLMLRGPTKIDLIFPSEKRSWSPAWKPSADTLEAIDRHFWDWIVWLEQKRRGGREKVLASSLGDMFELMLSPMGAGVRPRSVPEAVDSYLAARNALEQKLGVSVPRALETEVRPALLGDDGPSEAPERP
jgi:predicted nucleotidyltransferase